MKNLTENERAKIVGRLLNRRHKLMMYPNGSYECTKCGARFYHGFNLMDSVNISNWWGRIEKEYCTE